MSEHTAEKDAPCCVGCGAAATRLISTPGLAAVGQTLYCDRHAAEVLAVASRRVTPPGAGQGCPMSEHPAEKPEEGRILNPGAVGNPDETPVVQVSPALARYFERTRCPECGYINHCHTDDCTRVTPSGAGQ